MPPYRRARARTSQCRYAVADQRCRRIATDGEFCATHAEAIEDDLAAPPRTGLRSAIDDLVGGLFGVRPARGRRSPAEAGAEIAAEVLGDFAEEHLRRYVAQPCPSCRATGLIRTATGWDPCQACGGRGRVPVQAVPPGARPAAGVPPRSSASPPPRPRPSREAVDHHKRVLGARGTLGFEPDEPLDEAKIKAAKRNLARLYHDDGRSPDKVRSDMMTKVNTAADLLLAELKRPG